VRTVQANARDCRAAPSLSALGFFRHRFASTMLTRAIDARLARVNYRAARIASNLCRMREMGITQVRNAPGSRRNRGPR